MQPSVCCLMLVNGRPEMVNRAVNSFLSQTYENRRLMMYDTGEPAVDLRQVMYDIFDARVSYHRGITEPRTIGELRNAALFFCREDIVAHWDSDDWSHPKRLEEQVAALQAQPALECTGYGDMLFWKQECEAWVYQNGQPHYCLGTSLCYRREAWRRRPFEALPTGPQGMGEDFKWLKGIAAQGRTSFVQSGPARLHWADDPSGLRVAHVPTEPRMIASLHGGNTTTIAEIATRVKDLMMSRATSWDTYCREKMAL